MKRLRGLLLIICIVWLLYGLHIEHHRVHAFNQDVPQDVSGAEFIELTTRDGVVAREGALYAAHTLTPEGASAKDCKT